MRVEYLQVMYAENKLCGQPPQYVPAPSQWWRTATKVPLFVNIKMSTIHWCPTLTSWQMLFFNFHLINEIIIITTDASFMNKTDVCILRDTVQFNIINVFFCIKSNSSHFICIPRWQQLVPKFLFSKASRTWPWTFRSVNEVKGDICHEPNFSFLCNFVLDLESGAEQTERDGQTDRATMAIIALCPTLGDEDITVYVSFWSTGSCDTLHICKRNVSEPHTH